MTVMEIKNVFQPRRLWEEPEQVVRFVNVNDLKEYIANAGPPGEFKPHAWYNRDGDLFEIIWKDDPAHAETCGDLTLLRSMETGEVVGVEFFGPKRLMGLVPVPPYAHE